MKIGFSGTREGMTDEQKKWVRNILVRLMENYSEKVQAHHGQCIGADAEFNEIVKQVKPDVWRVAHPGWSIGARAKCEVEERRPSKDFIDRNHDIVNETDMLIAAPFEPTEQLRSGTWATIRYARKHGRICVVVLPDGKIEGEALP